MLNLTAPDIQAARQALCDQTMRVFFQLMLRRENEPLVQAWEERTTFTFSLPGKIRSH